MTIEREAQLSRLCDTSLADLVQRARVEARARYLRAVAKAKADYDAAEAKARAEYLA